MTLPTTRDIAPGDITTIEELHDYLYRGMQLEHATIPVYLTALYSLHPETNADAWHILRVIAIEEMLHLTLAANVMNAVGGQPDLTKKGFVPTYPGRLPDGETDFLVPLQPFSEDAVNTFLQIERPRKAPEPSKRIVPRSHAHDPEVLQKGEHRPIIGPLLTVPGRPEEQFYSIGEFYEEVIHGITYLEQQYRKQDKTLFTGDPSRQVTPEYYYSGGGEIIPVTDLESCVKGLQLIAGQGEGLGGGIYDDEGELAHYYRFQQLKIGRFYLPPDEPGQPTGPPVTIDWSAAYPVKKNPRIADYPQGSELRVAAEEFNRDYAAFLGMLTRAYTGQPQLLLEAVWQMFHVRDAIVRLVRNPIPGRDGVNAGPTFEVDGAMS
jgi:Ferritin-like